MKPDRSIRGQKTNLHANGSLLEGGGENAVIKVRHGCLIRPAVSLSTAFSVHNWCKGKDIPYSMVVRMRIASVGLFNSL